MSDELLKAGEIIRSADGTIWYVDFVTLTGAHIFELTGHEAPITTGKKYPGGRITKMVKRHGKHRVIAATSMVERIDPSKLDQRVLRRRIRMARKDAVPESDQTQETQGSGLPAPDAAAQAAAAPRATQFYVRTNKAMKEGMRGQGKTVLDAIAAKGTKPTNLTELATELKGKFPGTRQDEQRIIGFYLSKFKREGLINAVAPPAAAPVAETETAGAAQG